MEKIFNNIGEIEKYYVKETNTYVFEEDSEYLDVKFNFDLNIDAKIDAGDIITARDIYVDGINAFNITARNITAENIDAANITAWNITTRNITAENIDAENIDAENIDALNITAYNITARNINYFAVCWAYNNITCSNIQGSRNNARHFVLDGKLVIKGE